MASVPEAVPKERFVMAEANIIEEGMDRIEDAFRSIERDFRRLQKRADRRRKQLEKQAEKRVKQFQTDIRKNRVVKRAEDLRSDALKAIEEQVDSLLSNLRIASQADVSKLERKVAQLNKKVRELEKQNKQPAAVA
jgi:chromosome segregation ATPase